MTTATLGQTGLETLGSETILLVERHLMVAGAMVAYMEAELGVGFTVVSSLDDARHEIVRNGRFSLILVDINSCPEIGHAQIEALIAANGLRSVGLIADTALQGKIRGLIDLDICGVLLKSMSARSVANVIRFMLTGESFFPPALAGSPLPSERAGTKDFTAAETEILTLLAEGQSNREIARIVGKAEATVKMHVTSLLRKLNASNRTMAVIHAKQLRLI